MKHADAAALDRLNDLLVALRGIDGLRERALGIFYRRCKPFSHFHVDRSGLFADLRTDGVEFERYAVDTEAQRAALLERLRQALA